MLALCCNRNEFEVFVGDCYDVRVASIGSLFSSVVPPDFWWVRRSNNNTFCFKVFLKGAIAIKPLNFSIPYKMPLIRKRFIG